jgi:hypothetical protein
MARVALGIAVCALVLSFGLTVGAQRRDAFVASRDHPAIRYSTADTSDPIAQLNRRLEAGEASLTFEEGSGYLRSLLKALNVPVESQMLVFSQTSFQAPLINFHNPRAVYYTDTAAVGWVRGGEILEVAGQDPEQGVIFYALEQKPSQAPRLKRDNQCLACHLAWETLGVPGLLVQSVYPIPDELSYANGFTTVHGSPLEQRWGGWWVTGDHGGAKHMGNIPVMPADKGKSKLAAPTKALASVEGQFDLKGYPTPYSDVVPLLLIAHQTNMTNLITRTGWEARLAGSDPSADTIARVNEAAKDLVDYMLFVDEAPLSGVAGTSGFAQSFSRRGPRDSKGRSLRDLDLKQRLFTNPCSYMIYSDAFDQLPTAAKRAIYVRLGDVLSGNVRAPKYARLSAADRDRIMEILRETKRDFANQAPRTKD